MKSFLSLSQIQSQPIHQEQFFQSLMTGGIDTKHKVDLWWIRLCLQPWFWNYWSEWIQTEIMVLEALDIWLKLCSWWKSYEVQALYQNFTQSKIFFILFFKKVHLLHQLLLYQSAFTETSQVLLVAINTWIFIEFDCIQDSLSWLRKDVALDYDSRWWVVLFSLFYFFIDWFHLFDELLISGFISPNIEIILHCFFEFSFEIIFLIFNLFFVIF